MLLLRYWLLYCVIAVLAALLMLSLLAAYLRLEKTWQLVVAVSVGVLLVAHQEQRSAPYVCCLAPQ